jgi:hypothetical protein
MDIYGTDVDVDAPTTVLVTNVVDSSVGFTADIDTLGQQKGYSGLIFSSWVDCVFEIPLNNPLSKTITASFTITTRHSDYSPITFEIDIPSPDFQSSVTHLHPSAELHTTALLLPINHFSYESPTNQTLYPSPRALQLLSLQSQPSPSPLQQPELPLQPQHKDTYLKIPELIYRFHLNQPPFFLPQALLQEFEPYYLDPRAESNILGKVNDHNSNNHNNNNGDFDQNGFKTQFETQNQANHLKQNHHQDIFENDLTNSATQSVSNNDHNNNNNNNNLIDKKQPTHFLVDVILQPGFIIDTHYNDTDIDKMNFNIDTTINIDPRYNITGYEIDQNSIEIMNTTQPYCLINLKTAVLITIPSLSGSDSNLQLDRFSIPIPIDRIILNRYRKPRPLLFSITCYNFFIKPIVSINVPQLLCSRPHSSDEKSGPILSIFSPSITYSIQSYDSAPTPSSFEYPFLTALIAAPQIYKFGQDLLLVRENRLSMPTSKICMGYRGSVSSDIFIKCLIKHPNFLSHSDNILRHNFISIAPQHSLDGDSPFNPSSYYSIRQFVPIPVLRSDDGINHGSSYNLFSLVGQDGSTFNFDAKRLKDQSNKDELPYIDPNQPIIISSLISSPTILGSFPILEPFLAIDELKYEDQFITIGSCTTTVTCLIHNPQDFIHQNHLSPIDEHLEAEKRFKYAHGLTFIMPVDIGSTPQLSIGIEQQSHFYTETGMEGPALLRIDDVIQLQSIQFWNPEMVTQFELHIDPNINQSICTISKGEKEIGPISTHEIKCFRFISPIFPNFEQIYPTTLQNGGRCDLIKFSNLKLELPPIDIISIKCPRISTVSLSNYVHIPTPLGDSFISLLFEFTRTGLVSTDQFDPDLNDPQNELQSRSNSSPFVITQTQQFSPLQNTLTLTYQELKTLKFPFSDSRYVEKDEGDSTINRMIFSFVIFFTAIALSMSMICCCFLYTGWFDIIRNIFGPSPGRIQRWGPARNRNKMHHQIDPNNEHKDELTPFIPSNNPGLRNTKMKNTLY